MVLQAATRDIPALLAGYSKEEFWVTQVLFQQGREADALKLFETAIDRMDRQVGGNGGFSYYPAIDCYIRWNTKMDARLKSKVKAKFISGIYPFKGSTSNHQVMGATSRYLATQVWGNAAFPQGTEVSAGDTTGERFLYRLLDKTVHEGLEEYASGPYAIYTAYPILSLSELAQDSTLRQRAHIAFETVLAQIAGSWLHGIWAAPAFRSYPDMLGSIPSGSGHLPWLYFGGVQPPLDFHSGAIAGAVMHFTCPQILADVAEDRDSAFVFRSHFRNQCQYSFLNQHYAVFSQPNKNQGVVFGQTYPYGVIWEGADSGAHSHFWITNPAADIPDSMSIHTHGITKYQQMLQYRGTLAAVYSIPATSRFPYVLGFVPGGYQAEINEGASSGRLFLHYGTVLISLQSSTPFQWVPTAGIRAPAVPPGPGDSEFRIFASHAGVVLETALPSDFSGSTAQEKLQAFRAAILAGTRFQFLDGPSPELMYQCLLGTVLKSTFNGEDSINERRVDYSSWPELENPWMIQGPTGNLNVFHNQDVRTYDFRNWIVTTTGPESTIRTTLHKSDLGFIEKCPAALFLWRGKRFNPMGRLEMSKTAPKIH